jgi:hypothetical protein
MDSEEGSCLLQSQRADRGLGAVKIKERIEDEGDVDEGGEHHVEFFKA